MSDALRQAAHSAFHQLGPLGPWCGCGRELLRINGVWHCTRCGDARDPIQKPCPYCQEAAHVPVAS